MRKRKSKVKLSPSTDGSNKPKKEMITKVIFFGFLLINFNLLLAYCF
jgi:hypothetical protein